MTREEQAELRDSIVAMLEDEVERFWFSLALERAAMTVSAAGIDAEQFIAETTELAEQRGLFIPSAFETQQFFLSMEQQ